VAFSDPTDGHAQARQGLRLQVIDQKRFDEDPGPADLACGDEAEACKPLQCLGMHHE
jgi:hypothetical protein